LDRAGERHDVLDFMRENRSAERHLSIAGEHVYRTRMRGGAPELGSDALDQPLVVDALARQPAARTRPDSARAIAQVAGCRVHAFASHARCAPHLPAEKRAAPTACHGIQHERQCRSEAGPGQEISCIH
jgi:hypothetical protein